MTLQDEALALIVRSINALLTAEGAPFRVTAEEVVKTQRDGRLLIALTTTRDAIDYRNAQPFSTMQ